VNTTPDPNIAVGYAASAVAKNDYGTYGVVYTLDVTGLKAEPDVDALLWWYEKGGQETVREWLEHGEWYQEAYAEGYQGDTVLGYLIDFLPHEVSLEDADEEVAHRALEGDHESIRELLVSVFPQKRYLHDFDLDRVIKIETFMPFDHNIFDPYKEMPKNLDERLRKVIASGPLRVRPKTDMWLMAYGFIEWYDEDKKTGAVEATDYGMDHIKQLPDYLTDPRKVQAGAQEMQEDLQVIDQDEMFGPGPDFTFKTLWDSGRSPEDVEYHGSSGVELELAFPELGLRHDDEVWDWKGPWVTF
jgi:hypothetical protein